MPPRDPETLWSDLAGRLLINVISHPIEYGKALIQMGYEPIPPKPAVTMFGRPALKLPNIFTYVKHIKTVDGITGCYRGLTPRLCAYTISTITLQKTKEYLALNFPEGDEDEDDEDDVKINLWSFARRIIKHAVSTVVAVVVNHPLEVISLRMMAQFVGGETKYNGIFTSFVEIYRENGITGYYAGLTPRLIANISVVVLAGSSTYVINKYFLNGHSSEVYIPSTMQFLATTVTYPFLIVSRCMSINNCGLAAGLPPQMPIYKNWLDCWAHLSAMNQLKRGSSLLWRYYTGPQTLINGKLIPTMKDFNQSVQ